ncbi:alpha/beta fold hydrolase [Amycolatopsis sp., V23-08]|uniref:Alpha/beta fold hydrolase n=1 Tax=Amycolatopsis heterodermiae TaxID=3110235 RepID=A0ABU5R819_9PSEU|nr:alpha/beta fold hydrolase [Amycolatopsis sp., V23-08]MEA5362382.1 alpha/beta fold hydrolase [Amycolatopsis sp., V23-08]
MPGVTLTDHFFSVPLDHDRPAGEHIEVYAREVVAAGRERERLPWLLFLQGGPGMLPPRPVGRDSWLDRALDDYRVLLLDQRGTGRSSPITRQTLPDRGEPAAQADYLTHFRADAIVRDAELIRRELTGEPWSVLGQSFGGMCTVTYLSFAPEGLREAIITGGLPGLRVTPDEVYRAAYPRVHRKNAAFYRRYPQNAASVRRIAAHLIERPASMPDGSLLTVEAFQSLGMVLGTSDGADVLHYLLEDTWAGTELSDGFLARTAAFLSYAQMPLKSLMLELTYAQGSTGAPNWAAQRVRGEFPQFDARRAVAGDDPVLFTGETTYPSLFDQPCLTPLRETAEVLFARVDWPDLYDPQRLAANEVPVAAAVYLDDMYVDATYSLQTAETIRGLRLWATNEHEHDGLRVSGGRVLDHLLRMLHGQI